MEQFRRVLKLNPDSREAHSLLSMIHLMDSRFEDSISEAEKASALLKGNLALKAQLGFVYGMSGQKEQADKILNEIKDAGKSEYLPSFWVATVLFGLERSEDAVEHMHKAFEERSIGLVYFRSLAGSQFFRADARLDLIEERAGLAR